MDEQRERGPGGFPAWDGAPTWRYGAPWWYPGARDGAGRLPWLTTVALTAFVQIGSGFAGHGQSDRESLTPAARVLLLLATAALLFRHRHPVPVAYAVAGLTLVYLGAGYPYGPVLLAVAVACFAAVVAGHRRAAWGAVGALWAGHLLLAHWLFRWLPPDGDGARPWGGEAVVAVWVVAIVAVSEVGRVRREQWAKERAERARAARRRADEERLRMARELHDVLAHSISVINVQAGMGLALLDSDPEQARTALTTIKTASKEALGEVRQVLDTLRGPGEAPRAPAPGLDRLPELVEQAGSAGLTVDVTTEGTRAKLPPGADLAAFRIVQEALTNVVRHSGSRHARVRVRREKAALTLRVDDDGPATGAEAGGSGSGLAGMRERAAALGGTIEAGPRPDGGFRVTAVLPLAAGRDGTDRTAPREDQ
ncbi:MULTISPECIES: sensor histidine kinase [Streptomyces]|uniref:sensor histidine kinase n=1 Tax=Streptomyces TaxID=1883 RepID=UPI001E3588A9|nr:MULTISPECIES: sensor histidine kinase [Streptomyces]UFQ14254.1 sensor histidine kinase [Streptomyces huasconensis]WCL83853.1 sensor histidine kinase [Streptomyces sp. JCM 35825]